MQTHLMTTSLINIIVSPQEAFRDLRGRPNSLAPVALIIFSLLCVIWVYYARVDMAWLADHTVQSYAASPGHELSQADEQRMRTSLAHMSPTFMGVTSALSVTVALLATFFVLAMYLQLISAVTGEALKMRHWFSLVTWCSIPMVFASLATLINMLLVHDGALAAERMNPLSLRQLIASDRPGFGVFDYIDLTVIWALVLMIAGYRAWTRRSVAVSLAIFLAPLVLVGAIAQLL